MEKENIENLFEEENSSEEQVSSAFADLPPVAPVDYEDSVNKEPVLEETVQPEQTVEQEMEEVSSEHVSSENLNKEVLEHPDAKITLNKEEEEVIDKKELEELKNVKLSDNSSLKFVLILGVLLLIFIFLIPLISKYI